MKKWLVIVFFGLFFISIDSVSADSCYFNIVNKNVSRNHFVSADIGINKFISNVNEAIFFISYDSNALSVNEKNIIINNNWNVKLLDVIKDKNNLETLVVKIGNNEYLKESANLKFLNINFNVKSSFDLNETIVTFSSNVDNGYYKSMSKIYNVNDINNSVSCDKQEIKLKINDDKVGSNKNHSNTFIIYFISVSFVLILFIVIIAINNAKKNKV